MCFDTLLRMMGGADVNSPGDAQLYFEFLAKVRAAHPGITIITVCHEGKDSAKGILGSQHFQGAFENLISVNNPSDDDAKTNKRVTVHSQKMKDADNFADFTMQGEIVRFGPGPKDSSLVFKALDGRVKLREKLTPGEVGAALVKAKSTEKLGHTSTTRELALALAGSDCEDRKVVDRIVEALQRGANGLFKSYLHTPGRPGLTALWQFPFVTPPEEAV